MADPEFSIADFTISDAGKRGIAMLREAFDAQSDDKAAVALIGLARVIPSDAPEFEVVAVSFYGQSQFDDRMKAAVQIVSGVEAVFFVTPHKATEFSGKVLEYSDDRGFFLREP
jgi:hypothetical protein